MNSVLVARLENVANRMESILLKYDASKSECSDDTSLARASECSAPKLVQILENVTCSVLGTFIELSAQIGGDVTILGEMVNNVFVAHRSFLWTACGTERPDDAGVEQLVGNLSKQISAATEHKEKHRTSGFYDHICAVEAAVSGFGWVVQPKTPAPYIKDSLDTSLFYINRIFMAHKNKNDGHMEWGKTLKSLLTELHKYVQNHHTTGLVWNSEPGAKPFETTTRMENNSRDPIPPPPPPPPPQLAINMNTSMKKSDMSDLLASLNIGLTATSRLKKVTPNMQTHKNPALRENRVVSNGTIRNDVLDTPKTHAPRILWDGKFWKIDHQVGNRDALVEVTDKKEAIYIYKCTDSVITIKGKCNAITLDSCRKTAVVFDGLVGQCEIINCASVQIQTLGELPTVSIQKTDGCHIFLSREALDAQIIASKSSEMTVSAKLEVDENYTEMALPEQFVTQIVGKKLVTSASEIV